MGKVPLVRFLYRVEVLFRLLKRLWGITDYHLLKLSRKNNVENTSETAKEKVRTLL